jgi:His-Xaa-Ser system radical SAM maturase HxsB
LKRDFGVLPHSSCRIGGGHLLTNSFGSWCHISDKELLIFNQGKLGGNPALVSKLKKSGIMVDKKNIKNVINDYRNVNFFLLQGPSLHIVVPTLRCNHGCIYCHAKAPDGKKHDMDKKTAIRFLDFVFKSPSPAVTIEFQGGEPLLNWDTMKFIVEGARELNEKYEKKELKISVVTNLTLMDEKKLDFLIRKNVSICTSLDGPEKVHNANRKYLGGGPTYKDVTKWMGRVNDEYKSRNSKMKLHALPTITRHSLPYWKEIVDEYVKWGLDTIHLKFLNQLGAARQNWGEISYSPIEFIDFWKRGMDYIIELNNKGVNIAERMAQVMLTKILAKRDYGFTELMSPCGAGRTQLLYNHNGDIYTCDEGRMLGSDLFKLGNVNKTEYKNVIRGEKLVSVCYASCLENYCGSCAFKPFCGTCPVMNYVEQGTIVPKITETMRCKIFKSQFTYLFNRITGDSNALKIFKRWVHEGENQKKAA